MKKSAENRHSNASKKHGKPKTGLPKGSTITEIQMTVIHLGKKYTDLIRT